MKQRRQGRRAWTLAWVSALMVSAGAWAALAQAPPTPPAPPTEAEAAAQARANVEAATVQLNPDKECVSDDPKETAERARSHRLSAFMRMSAEMIQDAHTQSDQYWDTVETEAFEAMHAQVARMLVWPGILSSPAHARIAAFQGEDPRRSYIPQSLCRDAAASKPILCEGVSHPAVKPFCLAWVKLRSGSASGAAICGDFSPDQRKACNLFFGIEPDACKSAVGAERMWCGFIESIKGGSLPNCGVDFQADGCMRDILMTTTLNQKDPCKALAKRSEDAGRPDWASALLKAQCRAVVKEDPDACPPDPVPALETGAVPLVAFSDATLRGGPAGVIPVVNVAPWIRLSSMLLGRGPDLSASAGSVRTLCASALSVGTKAGKRETQVLVSSGALHQVHRGKGAPLSAGVDPFHASVTVETDCALTAPWIGAEAL